MSLDEKKLRDALRLIHAVAIGESTRAYMSIPADPQRDADLLLSAAIDELVQLRKFKAYVHERLDAMGVPAHPAPPKHALEGCRIGDRLDFLEQTMRELIAGADLQWKESLETIATWARRAEAAEKSRDDGLKLRNAAESRAELARAAFSTLMGKGHVLKYALKFVEDWGDDPSFTAPANRKLQLGRIHDRPCGGSSRASLPCGARRRARAATWQTADPSSPQRACGATPRSPSEGWLKDAPGALFDRLEDEAEELRDALEGKPFVDSVQDEAADVANFAMMIADVVTVAGEPGGDQ